MTETGNVTDSSQLGEVRRRRAGLRRTMTGLEEAASAPLAGRAHEWRQELIPHVEALQVAWESHVSATEGPGGLWEDIRNDAPRLVGDLRRLVREHETLAVEIQDLLHDLHEAHDDEAQLTSARERTNYLLTQLTRHRQRGADLIYEAYQHDVGGNG